MLIYCSDIMATLRTCKDGGWMNYTYNGNDIIFTCQMCGDTLIGDDNDRNRKSGGVLNSSDIQRRKLMKFAEVDPANPQIYKNCPKCKHNIAVFIEVSPSKKRYFKCKKCGNQEYPKVGDIVIGESLIVDETTL
jgi:DNA-directed RNA polymerase subunit M/transcription elongation factor TFIIS